MRIQAISRAVLCGLFLSCAALAYSAQAAPSDRYLHVKVEDGSEGSSVNVNIPLAMAEKVLPAIHNNQLHEGRVEISKADLKGVDIQQILDAIRTAPDNEFVTVKEKDQDVHILKSNGNIVIHVRDDSEKDGQKVDVTVPLAVADALFSTIHDNELNISAALAALDKAGQSLTITVEDASQHVRVWVDERDSQ
jgi:hypothetical protein